MRLRNPQVGQPEWTGAWANGSKEWEEHAQATHTASMWRDMRVAAKAAGAREEAAEEAREAAAAAEVEAPQRAVAARPQTAEAGEMACQSCQRWQN